MNRIIEAGYFAEMFSEILVVAEELICSIDMESPPHFTRKDLNDATCHVIIYFGCAKSQK